MLLSSDYELKVHVYSALTRKFASSLEPQKHEKRKKTKSPPNK